MGSNFKNLSKDNLIQKFKNLHKLKVQIDECNFNAKLNPVNNAKIFTIYHTIENTNMNAADMYNMMKALQHQLREQENEAIQRKKENAQRHFDNSGGIKKYLAMKNYLTDIGVNIHEIN